MANGQPGVGQGGSVLNSAEQQLLQAGYGGQPWPMSVIDSPDWVYMGQFYSDSDSDFKPPLHGTVPADFESPAAWRTKDQAQAVWHIMDPKQKQQVYDAVAQMNGRAPTDLEAMTRYNTFLGYNAQYNSIYPDQPISVFEMMRRQGESAAALRASRGGTGGGYSSVVNLTNPDDAQMLVDQALQTYLGRAATEEEATEFLKSLNKAERAAPIVTTGSQRSGGVNPALRAKEFARSQDEAAEFYATTQLSDWLQEAVMQSSTAGIASGL